MSPTPAMSASHNSQLCQHTSPVSHVSHEVKVVKVVKVVKKDKAAKEIKKRIDIPKLVINQTDQEWENWKSSTTPASQTSVTPYTASDATSPVSSRCSPSTKKLDEHADLNEDKEWFLKWVRKQAISLPG